MNDGRGLLEYTMAKVAAVALVSAVAIYPAVALVGMWTTIAGFCTSCGEAFRIGIGKACMQAHVQCIPFAGEAMSRHEHIWLPIE